MLPTVTKQTQFAEWYEVNNRATYYRVAVLNRPDGVWVLPSIGRAVRFDSRDNIFEHLSYIMGKFEVTEGDAEGLKLILDVAFPKR